MSEVLPWNQSDLYKAEAVSYAGHVYKRDTTELLKNMFGEMFPISSVHIYVRESKTQPSEVGGNAEHVTATGAMLIVTTGGVFLLSGHSDRDDWNYLNIQKIMPG